MPWIGRVSRQGMLGKTFVLATYRQGTSLSETPDVSTVVDPLGGVSIREQGILGRRRYVPMPL